MSRNVVIGVVIGLMTQTGVAAAQSALDSDVAFRDPTFFAVRVDDAEAASAWYREVLDLELVSRLEAEDGSYNIHILSGGELVVELIEQPGTEAVPGRHLGHFKAGVYATDAGAVHQSLLARAVDADAEMFTDPQLGVSSFVFRDLEGNRIQVFQKCGAC